jgi:hypothetical protein
MKHDRQCTHNVILRRVCVTMIVVGVCNPSFQASTQHAPFCHLWRDWLYIIFPHYPINGTIFGKKLMEHKMCVLFFFTTYSETLLIQRTNEWEIIINVQWSSRQIPIIIVVFELNFTLFDSVSKNAQLPNLIKILSVEAELFRAGEGTDGQNTANSRLSTFANESNKKVMSKNILVLHLTNCWHLHDIRIWNPIVIKL